MKICFITYSTFSVGGIERVVSIIANELSKDNEIDIVCTCGDFEINRKLYNLNEKVNVNIEKSLTQKGFIVKVLSKLLRELNKKTGILNNNKLIKILEKVYYPNQIQEKFVDYINLNKYDLVIGVAGTYSLLLGIISDRINAKTIGWQHNSYEAYLKTKERYFWNQDELFNKYIPMLNRYFVLTEHDRKMFLEENNIDSIVMHNPTSFNSKDKSKLLKKQFLAAGRFNYQKGFDLLIESFYKFSKENNDWNLVIVGEGEEKDNIEHLINRYGLNHRIKIEPFTNDIRKYFLNSSILLLPSRWEGMPMIVLESLVMGVPIVSYDITAVESSIRHNYNGLIIEKYNVKKFADAMHYLSNSLLERKKMGDNAVIKSMEFNIEKIGKEWNAIFDELNE
ncbi:glycosyltransferase [Clostridium beijerinckii]|uniref:Glycosyltransferase involved in cell wall biosynthesis n=1 Tax=Clostridium beijerinckii TaxID=1520 RepID=A0AAE5H9L7_CLOBE|nr:glycosyltransferase [Clostridium beijerinckii]NSB16557.1 glycosyltransferase involved in cell wall biosynthesis [Clostridium beijerinckii]OOM23613.1 alpha-D-kanosaminyltransferase [Clostridium beijerinckii]